jgi:DNA-binding NtrC family response regulator
VRELKNLVERVALLAPTSHVDAKTLMHLAGAPSGTHAIGEIQRLASKLASLPGPLTSKLDAVERMVLKDALLVAGNNKSEAARMLGMDRKVLERRFHRLGLGIADDHEDETKEKG